MSSCIIQITFLRTSHLSHRTIANNEQTENKSPTSGTDTKEDDNNSDASGTGYQVFSIARENCLRLLVTVKRGKGITRGKIKDWRKIK